MSKVMRFLPGHRLGFLDKLILHLFFISVIIYSSFVSSFVHRFCVFCLESYESLRFLGNDGANEGQNDEKMMTKMMKK